MGVWRIDKNQLNLEYILHFDLEVIKMKGIIAAGGTGSRLYPLTYIQHQSIFNQFSINPLSITH